MDIFVFVERLADFNITSVLPSTFWCRWTPTDVLTRHGASFTVNVLVLKYRSTEIAVFPSVSVLWTFWEWRTPAFEVTPNRTPFAIKVFVRINRRAVIFVIGVRFWTLWFRRASTLHLTFDGTTFPVTHFVFIDMSTETVLTVVLQIWTLRGRGTEAFGNTADWTLSAIDPFVRVDPRAVPLISPVFNFTFRSGWTSTDGSASYGALLVVDVFIDVTTVAELTVLAIYWWIGGAFGERRTTAL